jgi:hypothetical protein
MLPARRHGQGAGTPAIAAASAPRNRMHAGCAAR